MYDVVAGLLIGAILGSLATAAYLGACLKEEQEGKRSWIDDAIARAFSAVDRPVFEEQPPGT
jgi:hypothetical protein